MNIISGVKWLIASKRKVLVYSVQFVREVSAYKSAEGAIKIINK